MLKPLREPSAQPVFLAEGMIDLDTKLVSDVGLEKECEVIRKTVVTRTAHVYVGQRIVLTSS